MKMICAKRKTTRRRGVLARLIPVMFVIYLFAALTPAEVSAEDGRVAVDVDDENIVYMGRWEKGEDGQMHGSFECGLILRFTGTSVRVSGKAAGSVLAAVDGGEPKMKTLGKNTRLFSNLPEGEHTLELYSGAQQTMPTISGFSLDPGARTLPFGEGGIIEFIGDSIMEGYVDPNDAVNNVINSYMNSYAFLTGRSLMLEYGMRFNTVAYGGICILERGDNTTGNDPLGMPERYFLNREYSGGTTREAEREAAHKWDTKAYAPDYIVINLGTNDVSASGARVTAGMQSFLSELRATYADAKIFVMTPFNGTMADPISGAVRALDDDGIVLIDTNGWNIMAGSDWLHPGPDQHVKAAELLTETLRPYLEKENTDPETDATDVPADPAADGTEKPAATPGSGASSEKTAAKTRKKDIFFIAGGVLLAAAAITAALLITGKRSNRK